MGYLLQANITTALLVKSISESENQFMYVDGFPRNEENYQAWFQNLDQYDHNNSIDFGIQILLRWILKKLCIVWNSDFEMCIIEDNSLFERELRWFVYAISYYSRMIDNTQHINMYLQISVLKIWLLTFGLIRLTIRNRKQNSSDSKKLYN